ncbi:MAG TPA: hypothetical protein VF904_14915 [Anaeromyxobacteraceae bacterium]
MPTARKTPRLLEARGAITSVGLAMLLAAAAGAYLTWMWVPVYTAHYEVKQIVRQFGNEAVKNPNDALLVAAMIAKIRALQNVESVGPDGRLLSRPAIEVRPQDVTWERVEPSSLHVAFDYDREVVFPFLERSTESVMRVDLTMDVSVANWGSPR